MIMDFMVRMWFGVNGSGLDEVFRLPVISSLLLPLPHENVHREEDLSCLADCSRKDIRTLLMV